MTIRPATTADAEAAIALVRASIVALCAADHQGHAATIEGWLANKSADNMRRWIETPGAHVLLCERDSALAGVGGYTGDGDLTLLYVAPERTGAGVGTALLAAIEASARDVGLPRLRLTTTFSARGFFLAKGFTVMDEEGDIFSSGDGCELWKEL